MVVESRRGDLLFEHPELLLLGYLLLICATLDLFLAIIGRPVRRVNNPEVLIRNLGGLDNRWIKEKFVASHQLSITINLTCDIDLFVTAIEWVTNRLQLLLLIVKYIAILDPLFIDSDVILRTVSGLLQIAGGQPLDR